jgi:integrase
MPVGAGIATHRQHKADSIMVILNFIVLHQPHFYKEELQMARPAKEAPNHGNLYEVKITLGRNMDGKLERKSLFSPKSKQDARTKAEQFKLNCQMGQFSNENVSFAAFANKWLENSKETSVRANTYAYTYKNCIKNHLIPYFGRFAMASIHKADIQKFLNGKIDMSDSMLHKLRLTLNSIFEDACDNDILYKNPCKHVKVPFSEKAEKTITPYTAVQAQTVIKYAKLHSFGISIMILLKCGLRRSELLGLGWKDIDFQNNLIHIRKAVTETNGIILCSEPKSKTSIRTLPMDSELKGVLEKIPQTVIRYKGRGKSRIPLTVKNKYVISDYNGNAMQPSNWEARIYKKFMASFHTEHPDIPILKPHGLRHTYGSRLYNNGHGLDIYTIQKLMGHSSIEVTTRIYVRHDADFLKTIVHIDN